MEWTFGYEYEVAGNGRAVLDVLYNACHVSMSYLHEYHCRCDECEPDNYGPRGEWYWSAQEDCTVSAEFVSKILTWGTPTAERAFQIMERAAVTAGADLSGDSGMHVHVGKPPTEAVLRDDDGEGRPLAFTTRQRTTWELVRLFVRYQDDLRDIAAGFRGEVRGYNHPLRVRDQRFWSTDLSGPPDAASPHGQAATNALRHVDGSWFSNSHGATYEFRLWNTSKAAWRQRLAVAYSVAMTQAAYYGAGVTENDSRPLEDVIGPYLDAESWAGLIRQRFGKGGISQPSLLAA